MSLDCASFIRSKYHGNEGEARRRRSAVVAASEREREALQTRKGAYSVADPLDVGVMLAPPDAPGWEGAPTPTALPIFGRLRWRRPCARRPERKRQKPPVPARDGPGLAESRLVLGGRCRLRGGRSAAVS